jgi:hypothetical protein
VKEDSTSTGGSTREEFASRLADLSRRLERLESEREILRVLYSYGPGLDDGDEDGWVGCFTSDGVWETEGPGVRRRHHLRGRDELIGFAREHTRAPDHLHKHCVFDSVIEIDGETARSVSYFARLDALPDGPVVFAFGRYHDQLVREASGRWRIAHRRAEVQSTGPRQA